MGSLDDHEQVRDEDQHEHDARDDLEHVIGILEELLHGCLSEEWSLRAVESLSHGQRPLRIRICRTPAIVVTNAEGFGILPFNDVSSYTDHTWPASFI